MTKAKPRDRCSRCREPIAPAQVTVHLVLRVGGCPDEFGPLCMRCALGIKPWLESYRPPRGMPRARPPLPDAFKWLG